MDLHEKRLKQPGEDIFGLIFLVLSVGLFWQAYLIAGFSSIDSPGAFPLAAAAVMFVAAIIVVLGNRHHGRDTSGTPILPRVVMIFVALMVGYAVLLSPLGFLPSSFLFLLFGMRLLYRRGWLAAIVLSLGSLIVVYVIFRPGLPGGAARGHRARARHPGGDRPPVRLRGGAVMEALSYFATAWTQPYLLFLIALGTFAGIYIGAIPGLSVTMAVSILISFTFSWDVNDALCLMVGIFMGGVYGGSRTAILLNIPGAPSAIATAPRRLPDGPARRGGRGRSASPR